MQSGSCYYITLSQIHGVEITEEGGREEKKEGVKLVAIALDP